MSSNTFGFQELINKAREEQRRLQRAVDETLDEGAIECVGEIQSRTSVITGNLRRSATYGDKKKEGNISSVKVGYDMNQAPYADAYENGHKQQVGRYVPAIGKKLKVSFVPGRHVVKDSLTIAQAELPNRLRRKIGELK